MSVSSGPEIANDGLILCFDAANQKSILNTVEVLVVGGGGAGGGGIGGGGGGGGVIYMPSANITPSTSYTITVGAGGTPVVYSGTSNNGGDSTAFGATAKGGGGSGVHDSGVGTAGGSGGGAASNNGVLNQGGASSGNSLGTNSGFIYGNRGGNMTAARTAGPTAAAGGGGAGTAGPDTNSNTVQSSPGNANGRGGDGIPNSILGPTYYWGGGGGGGGYFNGYAGNGGLGGGGGGSCSGGIGPTSGGGSALNSGTGAAIDTNGGAGGANTGGGGGGGAWQNTSGGAGGSGIVVVRYLGSQRATGGTVTTVGEYTIHTFTTSGTFTPLWGDATSRGNNGTLTGGPTYNSSNGGSLVFDGTDDYISCGTFFNYTNFTISLWVYPGSTQTTYADIFDNNHTGGQNFVCQQNATNTNQYDFACINATNFSATSLFNLTANIWQYLTFTWNNSIASAYINGVFHSSGSAANPINYSNPNLSIARWSNGGRNWNGRISNFVAYNKALTATEIQQNFNATRGRFGI